MKFALAILLILFAHCAHMKTDEEGTPDLAAMELDKVSLYQRELSRAPATGSPLPSPYLRLGDNVLINGSFESPVLTAPWATYTNDIVPGWQSSWVDKTCTTTPLIELQSKDLFSTSPDQNQYTELDADNACSADARVKLMQSFASEINHIYRLSFWVRGRDTEHKMGLNVNAGQGYTLDVTPTADAWQIVAVYIEATSSVTTIAFTDTGDGDTFGTFLDAVEVRELTVDVDAMPHVKGKKPPKGKGGQSFSGGRRHKDCNRGK